MEDPGLLKQMTNPFEPVWPESTIQILLARIARLEDLYVKDFAIVNTQIDKLQKERDIGVERIKKLESIVNQFESPKIVKRIEKLEGSLKIYFSDPELAERLLKAEKTISELVDKIAEIANFHYREANNLVVVCPKCHHYFKVFS